MIQLDLFQTPALIKHSLEKEFSDRLRKKTRITFTRNRTSLLTVQKNGDDEIHLRIQEIFLQAPHTVWEAIGAFALSASPSSRKTIRDFITRNGRNKTRAPDPKPLPLVTKGKYYDLKLLYESINRRYFNGALHCRITWGRLYLKKRRRSISFGNYDGFSHLIKINRALDHPSVPEYFINYIVFHEMLHAKFEDGLPPEKGKRIHHSSEYCRQERHFADYHRAISWEKRNIGLFIK